MLNRERQSARMSKMTNDGLTRLALLHADSRVQSTNVLV